jgi:predicted ATP-binding protein involved in virulence
MEKNVTIIVAGKNATGKTSIAKIIEAALKPHVLSIEVNIETEEIVPIRLDIAKARVKSTHVVITEACLASRPKKQVKQSEDPDAESDSIDHNQHKSANVFSEDE